MQVLFILLMVFLAMPAHAATRYMSQSGSDVNDGQTTGTTWKTWTHAIANTSCGDTLIVLDGTYNIANGAPVVTKTCTASTVYTIKANNERAVFIDGSNGDFIPFYINNSAYITVIGIHARSGDKTPSTGGVNLGVINVYNSNHITLQRNIASHPNRYRNAGHVYQFYNSFDSLVEENEAYYFHRHGFYIGGNSSRNTVRRNYCNGRGYPDLTGSEVENPGSPSGPDDCFLVYPGDNNIFENNIAEGDMLKCYALEALGEAIGNQYIGNVCLGNNGSLQNGLALDARGASITYMPRDTVIKDFVSLNVGAAGVRVNGAKNTQCINCFIAGATDGFSYDRLTAQPGDGVYSGYVTNGLVTGATGRGVYIGTAIQTWTVTNSDAYNNSTNYSPSSSANYTPTNPPTANDPGMGSCKVWRPDGSYAKTHNQGADILYRYQDGVLTTIPLWDPTTGAFPHGEIMAGVNDIDGSSPYNVHVRLNVNTGGCAFPSSYGGGGGGTPSNPASYVSSSGSGAISQSRTIDTAQDGLLVFIFLRDAASNVGSVTGVSSSCGGGQALSLVKRATSTPTSPLHAMEAWYVADPYSGTCTISATTSGTVTSWIMTTIQIASTDGVSASAGAGGVSATPTVTVTTATNQTIYSATSGGSDLTLSAGPDQTLQTDTLLLTARLATSTQSGNVDGVMSYVEGGSSTWATVAVSMLPATPPPGTATFRLSHYQINSLYGSIATPEISIHSLGAEDNAGSVSPSGAFRIRAEIIVETTNSTQIGTALYCRKNAGAYAPIRNIFSSNSLRLYGPGIELTIPATLARTTQRFSGTFVPGWVVRDDAIPVILPAMAVNTRTELDYVLVAGNGTVNGDTFDCQVRRDDGTALDAYTVTPHIAVVAPSASMGF